MVEKYLQTLKKLSLSDELNFGSCCHKWDSEPI